MVELGHIIASMSIRRINQEFIELTTGAILPDQYHGGIRMLMAITAAITMHTHIMQITAHMLLRLIHFAMIAGISIKQERKNITNPILTALSASTPSAYRMPQKQHDKTTHAVDTPQSTIDPICLGLETLFFFFFRVF